MRCLLFAFLAFIAAASLQAETIRERMTNDPDFRLYVVILSVKQNADGSVREVKLSKVIEPRTGTTDPVKIEVPAKYLAAAEKLIRERKYEVDATSKDGIILPFATYFYYAPSFGPEPIVDLDGPAKEARQGPNFRY